MIYRTLSDKLLLFAIYALVREYVCALSEKVGVTQNTEKTTQQQPHNKP